MAKRKKRQSEDSAARTLEEIERESDRLAEWIDKNQMLLLAIAGGVLLLAAVVGFSISGRHSARQAASNELSALQAEYRVAMGASAGAFEIAEPANPETAATVRADFLARFSEVAAANRGDVVGAIAAIEVSRIEEALGDSVAALATLDVALDGLGRGETARVLLQTRRAALLEDAASWAEAAAAWQAAADQNGPLAGEWLANAARCWAEAGEGDKALAAWAKLEVLGMPAQVPPYVQALIEELETGV